jgi:hypothetical protein
MTGGPPTNKRTSMRLKTPRGLPMWEKLEKRRSLMNDWAQYICKELNRAESQKVA